VSHENSDAFVSGVRRPYRAIAHRVGRNVATVLRCCRAWFEDQCYRNFHRFFLVLAQVLYKVSSKYAIFNLEVSKM
jgi:hypothetical protein